jgi:sterol desaturase/sphingolipid hydroxylase (fatty acid hydroxylase superfamily)
VNALWAAHVVHHQSEDYNLAVALRQNILTSFTSVPFFLPLALAGVSPIVFASMNALSLLYQFWIHTELVGRLGWCEEWLNTPSHHRVHHGINPRYLDKNYGAIFIVWDRLFGTFEPERAPVEYGLTKNIETFSLWKIAFHEYAAIARDLYRARSWGDRVGIVTHGPAWRPPGAR